MGLYITGDIELVADNDARMLAAIFLQARHISPRIADNVIALHVGYATQCLLGIIVVLNDATDGIQMLLANSIERKAAAIQLYGCYRHPGVAQRAVAKSKRMNILLKAHIVSTAYNEEFVVQNGSAKVACKGMR